MLEKQPQLYELHTHLLGMGNVGFWIDTILCDEKIMPTNDTFRHNSQIRRDLCRLIWKKSEKPGFVNAERAAKFIDYLNENNDIPCDTETAREKVEGEIKRRFKDLSSTFWDLIKDEKFNKELRHRGMTFKDDFSYDVVLTLSDLAKGLNVDIDNGDDIAQLKIAEKLGIYLSEDTRSIQFRHWIIFNAREQKFEIVYGIRVEDLRKLIIIDITAPNEAKKVARAHLVNTISMCDAQGTPARHIDFHNFRGAFTPEFYPRRFALKDSIYSQRLDVLAGLIHHALKRYQACLPPVKYCEFSVGVGDLSRRWVFDVLQSFPPDQHVTVTEETGGSIYIATKEFSSFSKCVREGRFPYLEVAFTLAKGYHDILPSTPNVKYKFLAGFDRTNVHSSLLKNQNDALRLLNDSPHRAILLMLEEIQHSEDIAAKIQNSGKSTEEIQNIEKSAEESKLFKKKPEETKKNTSDNFDKLKELKKNANDIPWFYDWVVGIDLFGDELGYSYCPFVTYPFITYINDIRKATENGQSINKRKQYPHFGVRVHCGENVQYADDDAPAYRSFIAHMYIVFCCLRYLRYKLDSGIRIGHGIGFERILGDSMSLSTHRKSSILRAEMRHQAIELFKNIAFEVNITSNEYLLGDSLRQGNYAQTHCLDGLLQLKAPIILSTDDDGIWPIDRCSFVHPGHHSLTAEYCRAISSSLFKEPDDLKKTIENSKDYCFLDRKDSPSSAKYNLPKDSISVNTIILHPDLVKHILRRFKQIRRWKQKATELLNDAKTCSLTREEIRFLKEEILWTDVETNPLQNEGNLRQLDELSQDMETHVLTHAELRPLEDEEILVLKNNHRLDENDPERPFYQKYSPYYPNLRDEDTSQDDYTSQDEMLWENQYQSISQVAYVCSCIQSDSIGPEQGVPMPEEYRWLFKNDDNGNIFKYICIYWKLIHDEFMKFDGQDNSSKKYRHVLISPPDFLPNSNQTSGNTTVGERAIVSPTYHADKSSYNQHFGIEYIQAQQQRSQQIVIYIDRINIDAIQDPWKDLLKQIGLQKVSVVYYTNYDKNKFIYIECNESLQIAVNPRLTLRDKNEKKFLYALCPDAGAATAALHVIAEYINPNSRNRASQEFVSGVSPILVTSKMLNKEVHRTKMYNTK